MHHNRALCLCECGDFELAAAALAASPGAPLGPEQANLRCWLEGRIAIGLKDWQTAERRLGEARNHFTHHGLLYDAAITSLDLAGVHLAQGRTFEVKRLAGQTLRTFEEQSVPPEMAEALKLFLQAAAADQLSLETLASLRHRLEEARRPARSAL
ncbi:MAG: hypothetical protein AAF481_09380 [Acidobacteriota bacterium]